MDLVVKNVDGMEPLQLTCRKCDAKTLHKIVTLVEREEVMSGGSELVWTDYMVVMCRGCETASFCENVKSTVETYHTPIGDEKLVDHPTQYPKVMESRGGLTEVHLLPDTVYAIYTETLTAISNALPVLAAAGIRAIVETVCNEVGAKGGNLQARIDGLQELGTVTAAGADVLHKLRFMGNEAVHEVSPPTEEGLRAALDVVDYLLQGVYVIPKKAEQLPEGKQKS